MAMTMSRSKLQTQMALKGPSNLSKAFSHILVQLVSLPIYKFRGFFKVLLHDLNFNGQALAVPATRSRLLPRLCLHSPAPTNTPL